MTYRIVALFLFSLMLLVAGCSMFQTDPQKQSLTIPSAYNSLPDTFREGGNGLSLRSDQEAYKLPLEELAVIIANTGSNSITLGEQRMLEKLQEGVWYKVPYRDEFAFTDIGLGLGAEEKLEQKIPLEYLDYRLTPGTYRIVKTFYINEGAEEIVLAAEFEIKE